MTLAFLVGGIFILLGISVPIFLALLVPSIISVNTSGLGLPYDAIVQHVIQGVNIPALLAIPLFILAADIISRGEIGERLIRLVDAWIGHIPGGLGIATAITMAIFGAISGVGVAAVVSIGPIVYPALIQRGFSKSFALGLILCGATLSMLIPPSVAAILYCLVANQSIAQVFLASLSSGLIFMGLMIVYSVWTALRLGDASGRRFSLSTALHELRRSVFALMLPAIIIGGIYSGLFTVTEAAAVSAVYAVLVEVLLYKRIKAVEVLNISTASVRTIGLILILIGCGAALAWFLTLEQVPQKIVALVSADSAWEVIGLVDIIFLIAGMFVDTNSAVIVLTPLLMPLANSVGIDGVHLGAVITMTLAIGQISPPFGLNLFVGMATFKVSFSDTVKGILPFMGLQVITLLIISFIPQVSLWLPSLSNVY